MFNRFPGVKAKFMPIKKLIHLIYKFKYAAFAITRGIVSCVSLCYNKKNILFQHALILFFCIFILLHELSAFPEKNNMLRLHVIDVGYGDCLLIEYKNTQTATPYRILIDTGFAVYQKRIWQYLASKHMTHINTLILTHNHPNHYGSARTLLHSLPIKTIYWNGHKNNTPAFKKILRAIQQQRLVLKKLSAGEKIAETPNGLDITCLHPHTFTADENNNSLVLLVRYKKAAFLLTGDIDAPTQDMLAATYQAEIKRVTALIIPHHGDILGQKFSAGIKDAHHLIISGNSRNRYGLPKAETLTQSPEKIWFTGRDGTMIIEATGEQTTLRTEKRTTHG